MPELPDVENYKRYLDSTALHKDIAGVHVGSARVLRGVSASRLGKVLKGRSLEKTRRHGKHLLVRLDDGGWLTFHFGMTGRFTYFTRPEDDPKHDRLRLDFANGDHLAFENQRLLGEVGLASDADDFVFEKHMGPDALALGLAAFRDRLAGKRGGIKSALMDQSLIAGIGNVYADEILFQAGIHPATPVSELSQKDLDALHRAMRGVLETAIDCGAGTDEVAERVPKDWLLPRRRDGAECPRCGGQVKAIKTGGRRGYHCAKCQPRR